jgi:putative FmdB family regulatory protein
MPIYEYECVPNKHRFEVIQKFSDPPVSHCTICGAPVHKLLSPPAIQFKGTGWYVTDYAGKNASAGSGGAEKKTEEKKEVGSAT